MENPFESNPVKRPTFLTIVCILTFIGSGWGVLSNLFSLFTAGIMDSMVQTEQYTSLVNGIEEGERPAFFASYISSSIATLQATFLHAREIAITNLVLNVISLLGAMLMFQLRRFGFYLYAAAQILLLFVLPYFAGFNFYVMTMMLFSGIFSLLFLVFYTVNLKYMVK